MNKQEHVFSLWLLSILACLLLTACGSGGDDKIPLQGISSYQLTATSPSSSISPSGSTTISITLLDTAGNPAAGQTVQLSKTGPATLSAGSVTTNSSASAISVVTDAAGTASAILSGGGAAVGSSGAVEVKYTDSKGSIAKQSVGYSVQESESIILTLSKTSVNSGTGDSVALTALVINSDGQVVTKAVTFGVSGGIPNGTIVTSGTTSANYLPSTTDRSNKQVTVTATLAGGAASTSATISVTGTTLQLSSPTTSATLGDTITLQGSLKDGNGSGIVGANVTLTSPNLAGGTQTVTTGTGGSFPAVSAVISSAPGGVATFAASSNGASSSLSLTVSGVSFGFATPAAGTEIAVNTPTSVTLTHLNNGAPIAGTQVFFSTSLGAITGTNPGTTNASGQATVSVSSAIAGQAVITANTAGGALQASRGVLFVSSTPSAISVQAGQTNLIAGGQTPITATVLDAASNPVKGKVVEFSLVKDESHGAGLSSPTAITDASGKAAVSYTAGPDATSTNGVEIRAKVQGTSITTVLPPATPSDAMLTVGGLAQFISITSGNTLGTANETSYSDPRGVLVTDASGNPVASKVVTLSVIPTQYYKGQYVQGVLNWVANITAVCANEDVNSNSIIDPSEDINTNGLLTPGNPVTLSSASVTTNAQGIASFSVIYGKNYGNWLRVKLKATSGVAGTESVSELAYDLPVLAADVVLSGSPPGGAPSAFGEAAVCTNPN